MIWIWITFIGEVNKFRRKIQIFNGVRWLNFSNRKVFALFRVLDSSPFKISEGELSVAFLDKETMQNLHLKFSNDDTLTDVITFEGDQRMNFAGEICVSPDYAHDNCKMHGTTFSEELSLYLIHGYLHIHGLDDISSDEAKKMREGECICMAQVKNANALPTFLPH
ncbi:MAG: rRNA maturation RNase YbeY [Puniceicoccales bacterium]|jgi:probable rRNA maturation factor|nr:rRNA maturation RNase YbeY [Puniceicoccales bacterium]